MLTALLTHSPILFATQCDTMHKTRTFKHIFQEKKSIEMTAIYEK
jgi:hypothetical protein